MVKSSEQKHEFHIFKKVGKTFLSVFMASTLLFSTIHQPTYAETVNQNNGPKIKLLSESHITEGVILKKYEWSSLRKNQSVKAQAQVIRVDLSQPHVKIDTMTGNGGKFTTRATVHQMSESTKAVAGINGDYYSMRGEGVPIGPQAKQGELISSPSQLTGMYAFGISKGGKPSIHSYKFEGTLTTASGKTHSLTGINKTNYRTEPDNIHSHANTIYVYTSDWGNTSRANDGYTTPTEVLVRNGIVQEISVNKALSITPPEDGYILRSTRDSTKFITDHVKVGDLIQIDYQLISTDGKTIWGPNDLQMLIGGHTLLVDQGKKSTFTRDVSSLGVSSARSRSAVGYSQDERYAYFVTVDHYQESKGMTLPELQDLLLQLGVWKGVNLDGGGSTQMVSRPLGEFSTQLTNQPEFGSARLVVNGIGIYSTAPAGSLKDMLLSGKESLLIHEQASYSMKAYDKYYNPIDVTGLSVQWDVPAAYGRMEANVFTAEKSGWTEISAAADNIRKTKKIEIIGREHIGNMIFNVNQPYMLSKGESYVLPVVLRSLSGTQKTVPKQSVDWEFIGFEGRVEDGTIYVDELHPNRSVGYVIARYDGFSTMLTLPVGESKMWADFDKVRPSVSTVKYPAEVEGSSRVVYGLPGADYDDFVLYMDYDFSSGTGTKALYAAFDGDQGIEIEGKPYGLKLDLMADNSLNWVRAQIVDAQGKTHLVDIVQDLNWHGWKEINVNFDQYDLNYPIKLKRIYVASPEQRQEEREVYGKIAIDDISFLYQGNAPEKLNPVVQLTIGQTQMRVDEKEVMMDQPAIIKDDRTLVPLRFIADALQGDVMWDATEKKVSLIRSDQWIEMRVGEKELIIDGKRVSSNISPEIINSRTMVPLRLVSEAFGWRVKWDNVSKTIELSI